MSQQKALIVVCFLAGAVALVSGQQLNWERCSSEVRSAADEYRKSIMNSGQALTNAMQNAGAEATDISAMQSDIDKMTNSIAKLTDMSNGFDMNTLTSVYMENLSTMTSMFRNSIRLNLIPTMMGTYLDMANSVMASNTKFMTKVTESCVPSSRTFKLRQTV